VSQHLKANGYAKVYQRHRKNQKTRAAADIAFEMEALGEAGVTAEIRGVLQKVVSLARAGSQ